MYLRVKGFACEIEISDVDREPWHHARGQYVSLRTNGAQAVHSLENGVTVCFAFDINLKNGAIVCKGVQLGLNGGEVHTVVSEMTQ